MAGGAANSNRAETFSSSVLTIDLTALAENYRTLCRLFTGKHGVGAAVKANAYGLGLERVAPVLRKEGCEDFFCASLDEALDLKALLPDVRVHLLNGLIDGDAKQVLAAGIIPVLNDFSQIERWSRLCADATPHPAAIHLDSGMSRLGLPPAETERLEQKREILAPIGPITLMSHLACADEPSHPLNRDQLEAFRHWSERLPADKRSLANSSGLFLGAEYHFDLARPGIALYGGNPTPGTVNPMRQVVRLQGRILQVRVIDAPQSVGYGASHKVAGKTRIATVAAGYADGYLRQLSGRGSAWIGGQSVPVVGRVSMDLITLDVSAVPEDACQPGGFADLIGAEHDVNDLAAEAGTIPYEILTSLGARYQRRYLEA